jgi:hypothetical protein
MQTFTPYSDFKATARALDTKRLGKQRVEVIQIVRALTVPGYAWASHPAVLMWKGYEEALGRYGLTMCEVWVERWFGDTCAGTIVQDWPVRSTVVIERELRKEENARRREQRRLDRLAIEVAKARRRRSLAAKRGWKTRKAQHAQAEFQTGD